MFITYIIIRLITLPFAFLPYSAIHLLGERLGALAYHLIPKYRKRALSNLTLSDLGLSHPEIKQTAKSSIQSLMITCLEYPRLAREKNIARIARCENPEKADAIMAKGKGVIFFCGHQSNWELLFLEGTSRMPGVAIGRPIKNRYLYAWVQQMRQKFGGTMITPKNALKEGLRGLKRGAFLGIVGDQGMPDSNFSSPFLGRSAYTSPAPALLAYKTNTPIIVATTRREKGKYLIHYSHPIYPNLEAPLEGEVRRLMLQTLAIYEDSIRERPHEWLWVHNRWKQQTLDRIKKPFRQDSMALFLPDSEEILNDLPKIRELYPKEHISLFVPRSFQDKIPIAAEVHSYESIKNALIDDFRYKLIFNFTGEKQIDSYYKKRAAQTIVHLKNFSELEKLVKHD